MNRLITDLGRSLSELTQIVVTHCHLDHVGSLATLKSLSGAKVAVHNSDAGYISKVLPYPMPKKKPMAWLYSAVVLPFLNSSQAVADVLLEDGMELNPLGGLRVVHTPGHTPGSICLYSPAGRILFAGDTLRYAGGKLCLPYKVFSNDWDEAQTSIGKIAGLEFDTVCFGHGEALMTDASAKVRDFWETNVQGGTH